MKVFGLITARGGSKGIPGKNLVPVAGAPLIAWTIRAAQAAKRLDRVVLSTDDAKIAEAGRQFGAEVPFLRPDELASDNAGQFEVILHALDYFESIGDVPDYVMLLQPTSPLRTAQDIDAAIELAEQRSAKSVVSVCPSKQHPYFIYQIDDQRCLKTFASYDIKSRRRQDLPPAFSLNGAIYLSQVTALRQSGEILPEPTLAYVMPKERSLDIDEPGDIALLRWVMEGRQHDAA